eukprot:TRINITY_DN91410_c0_g1_i1.p1 TRINITY_DN91410_c0_g1~~TRINITY_DN91410_c0_g1_i1.p1  ORF type:complete len:441 (+),score=84.18 TRINITY_DN91410_c0_g1_i1:94-1416(+)
MVVKRKQFAGGAKAGKSGNKRAATAAKRATEDAMAEAEGEIASDSGSDAEDGPKKSEDEDDFFESETPDERRVRLAKEYLSNLGDGREPGKVQEQLTREVEEENRRNRIQVEDVTFGESRFLKGHKMATTCICMSSDESTIWTGGKDCAVIRWDVETGKKDVFPGGRNRFDCGGHFEKVLSVRLVEQRGLLVTAGVDRFVRLWDPRAPAKSTCTGRLQGHTNAVTAVQPEIDGDQLYSASLDKSLKIWDLGTRRCTETLLGHVAGISSLDLFAKGRPVSGGADKTVRFWKIDKDTHLMFAKHMYPVDSVGALDHERFVSGSQDGSLMLWSSASKKPLATGSMGEGKWVASLAAIRQGNVFFSGSVDGTLRAWRTSRAAGKGVELSEASEPVIAPGCINGIAVGKRLLACAIGKEHRLGRWFYDKQERNGIMLVPLSYREA